VRVTEYILWVGFGQGCVVPALKKTSEIETPEKQDYHGIMDEC